MDKRYSPVIGKKYPQSHRLVGILRILLLTNQVSNGKNGYNSDGYHNFFFARNLDIRAKFIVAGMHFNRSHNLHLCQGVNMITTYNHNSL
jgi:hypothetical protein